MDTNPAASFFASPAFANAAQAQAGTMGASSLSPSQKVSKDFEAVFLQQMIDTMFSTIEGGGTFGDSNASETWRGMLSEQYAKSIVQAGGIGIADAVQRELISLQEGNAQ